jgi:hypothetical protein|tara:strand:+ start:472 stop:891 length:420 start_codon:yes stop_codon:yes gene_type:complete
MSDFRDQYQDTPAGVIKYVAAARDWPISVAYTKAVAFAEIETPSWEGFLSDEFRASRLRTLADMVREIDQPGSERLASLIEERARAVVEAEYDWTGQVQETATSVGRDFRTVGRGAFRGLQVLGPLVLGVAILYTFGRK